MTTGSNEELRAAADAIEAIFDMYDDADYQDDWEKARKGLVTLLEAALPKSSPDALRSALEHIVAVASGESQVAVDDTEGIAYIDKYARTALAVLAAPSSPIEGLREAVQAIRDELGAMELTANRKTKVGRAAEAVIHLVRVRLDAALAPQGGPVSEEKA